MIIEWDADIAGLGPGLCFIRLPAERVRAYMEALVMLGFEPSARLA